MVNGFNKAFGGATGADKLNATGGINPAKSFVMGKLAANFMTGPEVKAAAKAPAANKLKK
jgi:hypothetical protein